jgi:hypothetical protein
MPNADCDAGLFDPPATSYARLSDCGQYRMSTIAPTTVKHNVGKCPACRDFLWAEVDIEVSVGAPTMTRDGTAIVNATPRMVGMRVEHSCQREEEDQ